MTARENTHSGSDNSAPRVPNPDAQTILEYLETVDSATLQGLAAKAQLRESHLRDLLDQLQADGLVTVTTGFRSVRVEIADEDSAEADHEIVTDGGRLYPLFGYAADEIDADVDLTAEQLWSVLSSVRRRRIIRFLAAFYGPPEDDDERYIEVTKLAAVLARAETALRANEDVGDRQHRIYVALVQTHVPMLDDFGVVEYFDRPQKLGVGDDVVDLARLINIAESACSGGDPQ